MQNDLYNLPKEPVKTKFYVVSLNKFAVLSFGTAGLYLTYWFYKQWQTYKEANDVQLFPVVRAVFPIFFVYSLFQKLTELYQQKSGKESNVLTKGSFLFIFVGVLSILFSSFLNAPSPESIPEPNISSALLNLISTPLLCWFCYQAQWFANYVCDDINGEQNNTYNMANYIWLGIGFFVWYAYLDFMIL